MKTDISKIASTIPKQTFILITSDGDNEIPSKLPHSSNLLHSRNMKRWFTQNIEKGLFLFIHL
jgi:hypothetical protein